MASYYGFVVFVVDFIIHAVIVGGFFLTSQGKNMKVKVIIIIN